MSENVDADETAARLESVVRAARVSGAGGVRRGRMAQEQVIRVSSRLCRDPRISYNAKGVWVAIAAHEDGAIITVEKLALGKDKRHAVRSGLAELMANGYLIRGIRVRNDLGRLGPFTYTISDLPGT